MNKKYYFITITIIAAIIQIASGLSSSLRAEDDLIRASKQTSKLSTLLQLEHSTTLDEYNYMATALNFYLMLKASQRIGLMIGLAPEVSYQGTTKNENQVNLVVPPFVNVAYSTGLKAGPFSWTSVYFRVYSTTPDLYQNNSVYSFLRTGTLLSLAPVSFFEMYYNGSVYKYFNEHNNSPTGSNTNVKLRNTITFKFILLQKYKYCKSLSLSMDLIFDSSYKYSGIWIGTHHTTFTLQYDITDQFHAYTYFYSTDNNLKNGKINFNVYHRNNAQFVVGVGSYF